MEMSEREIREFARKLYFEGYTTENTERIKDDYGFRINEMFESEVDELMQVLGKFERYDTDMGEVNIEDMACALYDGDWRKEDRDELKTEYNLTDTEADRVCAYLERLEIENSEDDE